MNSARVRLFIAIHFIAVKIIYTVWSGGKDIKRQRKETWLSDTWQNNL